MQTKKITFFLLLCISLCSTVVLGMEEDPHFLPQQTANTDTKSIQLPQKPVVAVSINTQTLHNSVPYMPSLPMYEPVNPMWQQSQTIKRPRSVLINPVKTEKTEYFDPPQDWSDDSDDEYESDEDNNHLNSMIQGNYWNNLVVQGRNYFDQVFERAKPFVRYTGKEVLIPVFKKAHEKGADLKNNLQEKVTGAVENVKAISSAASGAAIGKTLEVYDTAKIVGATAVQTGKDYTQTAVDATKKTVQGGANLIKNGAAIVENIAGTTKNIRIASANFALTSTHLTTTTNNACNQANHLIGKTSKGSVKSRRARSKSLGNRDIRSTTSDYGQALRNVLDECSKTARSWKKAGDTTKKNIQKIFNGEPQKKPVIFLPGQKPECEENGSVTKIVENIGKATKAFAEGTEATAAMVAQAAEQNFPQQLTIFLSEQPLKSATLNTRERVATHATDIPLEPNPQPEQNQEAGGEELLVEEEDLSAVETEHKDKQGGFLGRINQLTDKISALLIESETNHQQNNNGQHNANPQDVAEQVEQNVLPNQQANAEIEQRTDIKGTIQNWNSLLDAGTKLLRETTSAVNTAKNSPLSQKVEQLVENTNGVVKDTREKQTAFWTKNGPIIWYSACFFIVVGAILLVYRNKSDLHGAFTLGLISIRGIWDEIRRLFTADQDTLEEIKNRLATEAAQRATEAAPTQNLQSSAATMGAPTHVSSR